MRLRSSALVALVLSGAAAAHAAAGSSGWASLGASAPPSRERDGLVFRSPRGEVLVSVLSPHVVRVRSTPAGATARQRSYAVMTRDLGPAAADVRTDAGRTTITTAAVRVEVRHDPLRVAFFDALTGESLDEDDAERGMAFAGSSVRVWKRLRDDEHVYGLGEKSGRLDKRGWKLGGTSVAFWNSDTYLYDGSTDPLYASVPFFLVLRAGKAHGIFMDETHRASLDVGRQTQALLSFGADGGTLDYYFLHGPSPKEVVERYTALTGRMPLPPLWALGYHQCRYSYYPESRVREIATEFRKRRIPADAIWLDIHHLDGFNPLTWDRERFPEPARLIADLRAQGLRVVTIEDPHPKKQPGDPVYDSGLAGGHFVRHPDGSLYEAPVWPSRAERSPGPSVFPDYSRPETRDWWGGLLARLTDVGVAGIWNDMNEPAVFETPTGTMPLDVRHDGDGHPTDHREIHNVYGMLMSRATWEGLARLRPDERPFVLTRATFAGGQRWAALWTGDNGSDWSHLRGSVPMLLGLGVSGMPFVGSDVGGYAGAPSAELFTRWLQVGIFYPFLRAHTELGSPDQEPWSYGPRHEAVNRRAIELRYELLPHVYDVLEEASATGVPAMRPLFLEFPGDAATYDVDDQFLFGSDLLVAPVLREAAAEREVYLPAGDWYDYWTGAHHEGARPLRVPVTLDSLPLFVRGGAFVFRQPVVQHTGERAGQPLRVFVYPAASSASELYEDDGESLASRRGVFARRRFEQQRADGSCVVTVEAARGSWRPARRDLVLHVRWDGEPRSVQLDGRALPRGAWTVEDGFVVVARPDDSRAHRLVLEP